VGAARSLSVVAGRRLRDVAALDYTPQTIRLKGTVMARPTDEEIVRWLERYCSSIEVTTPDGVTAGWANDPAVASPFRAWIASILKRHPELLGPGDNEDDRFLWGLPAALIKRCYGTAPGNELESGKIASPESSAALAANAFGLFLIAPSELPPLPRCDAHGWPTVWLDIETTLRLPWPGGEHPCLDAVVETATALIGVESKRFEPFATPHNAPFPMHTGETNGENRWPVTNACGICFATAQASPQGHLCT
jgi:hypothetical protein